MPSYRGEGSSCGFSSVWREGNIYVGMNGRKREKKKTKRGGSKIDQ
jgi:hypothetical protein